MYRHLSEAEHLEDLKHDCHQYLRLRERVKGKGTAYTNQCTFCGMAIGHEISKKGIQNAPPTFDTKLEESYWEKYKILSGYKSQSNKFKMSVSPLVNKYNEINEYLHSLISELNSKFSSKDVGSTISNVIK